MNIKLQHLSRCLVVTMMVIMTLLTITHYVHGADSMPVFSLPSALDGKKINSASFQGKALLITFFATWCPPCMQEIPTLIQLQEDYSGKGFSVIGLIVGEAERKEVINLVDKRKINYPILMSDEKIISGFGNIPGIPTSFLVNREGNIVRRYPGYVPHAMLEKDIKSIL